MLNIGAHLSSTNGFLHMAKEAVSIKANTFQFFTRNPRGFKAKDLNLDDIDAFHSYIKNKEFAPIIAHAPYTLNPCSADKHVRELAHMIVEDDLARMEHLPGNYYNIHPGSHVKQGVQIGISYIVYLLNKLLTPKQSTMILLETMSGKGTEIGSNFEELRAIMDQTFLKEKLGVCLDLCHVWDAGYDIVHDLEGVLKEFNECIGLENLKAIHLNDSKNVLSSHKDRHETIGEGEIGLDAIKNIINHPKLRHLPFILETPLDVAGHGKEIALLKSVYQTDNL